MQDQPTPKGSGPFAAAVRHADRLEDLGRRLIYITLAIIYFWFGLFKFQAYEAEGISGLVANSPLLSWMYALFDVRGFGRFLGILEITVGLLIAGRLVSPKLSALGGLLSMGLFFTTISFIATTPGAFQADLGLPYLSGNIGQFLIKDIVLFSCSLWILGNSLNALRRPR